MEDKMEMRDEVEVVKVEEQPKEVEEVSTEETPTPNPEAELKAEKLEFAKKFVTIYKYAFDQASKELEGKALKDRFETVEKSLRRYRKNEEEAITALDKEVAELKIKYTQAAKNFENMAAEEFDPSRYDRDVLPIEQEFMIKAKKLESKRAQLQGIRMLTTKMFAKDKSAIPSIIHSYAILKCIRILTEVVKNNPIKIDNDNSEEVKAVLEFVNTAKEIAADTKFTIPVMNEAGNISLQGYIDYFKDIVETTVDKNATRARESKDLSFKMIKDVCDKHNIKVLAPEGDMSGAEYELVMMHNRIKMLEECIRVQDRPVKNYDDTMTTPITKEELPEILEYLKAASLFLNGDITSLMDEKMLEELPFRTNGLITLYRTVLPGLAGFTYNHYIKDMPDDSITVTKEQWFMMLTWLLLSTSVIDTIPTLVLML